VKRKKLYKKYMPKRTFQPNERRKLKKHGFRNKMKTRKGKNIIKKRRDKKRSSLSSSDR